MREIFEAFLKSGAGSVPAMLCTAVSTKIIASTLGPIGVGLLSMLKHIIRTASVLAMLNGQSALIQGGATFTGRERTSYYSSVIVIYLVGTSLTCLALVLAAPLVSQHVLHRSDGAMVSLVRAACLPVILGSAAGYFLGVLNSLEF